MKKYIKLCLNPLGLKSVVISNDNFTDENLDDEAKTFLEYAIKANLAKEVIEVKEVKKTPASKPKTKASKKAEE